MIKPRVFLIASITADGFIAKNAEQFADWSSKEDKKLFVQLTKQAGVMVMGNTTYKLFPKPLPHRKHIVYTRDTTQNAPESVSFTNASPAQLIKSLAQEGYEEIAIIGGQKIYDMFLQAGLIDELYLVVEPLLFGQGVQFTQSTMDQKMKLLESKNLNENTVMLHYEAVK